jgi:hypothetical protein
MLLFQLLGLGLLLLMEIMVRLMMVGMIMLVRPVLMAYSLYLPLLVVMLVVLCFWTTAAGNAIGNE